MSVNVMLVDDSAAVRLLARRALSEAGFGIIEACDGVEALEKLQGSDPIAVIFCDVNMPRMNGIELLEELARREGFRPPVVMLTTEGHPQLIKRAKECGAKGWMVKPFKCDQLVAAARKITGA